MHRPPEELRDRRLAGDLALRHRGQAAQRVVPHDLELDPRLREPLPQHRVRVAPDARRAAARSRATRSTNRAAGRASARRARTRASPSRPRQPPLTSPTTWSRRRARAVEEHLVELRVPGDLLDRPDLDAGLVHRHEEVRDPAVPWRVAIGPGEHEAPLGPVRERRPDLLPAHRSTPRPTGPRPARRGSRCSPGPSPRSAPSSPGTTAPRRSRSSAGTAAAARRCRSAGSSARSGPRRRCPTRPGPPARAYSS